MAYELNGTNQDFSMASSPVSALPITIASWFWANNTVDGMQLAAVAGATVNRPYYALNLRGDVSGDPVEAIAYNGSTSQSARTTAAYSVNTWTHGCAVFSSTISRTAYINGGSSSTNASSLSSFTPTSSRIGVFVNSSGAKSAYLSGRIAEVGIWSAALTAAEVASLAKGMTCDKVRPQSLVFYAPLVRDIQDARGGLAITNNGGSTVTTHPRVYA